jgi:hypothetical protein
MGVRKCSKRHETPQRESATPSSESAPPPPALDPGGGTFLQWAFSTGSLGHNKMPLDDDILEVYKQHRAEQDKYTYFLLAAAAAAIGFAVQKTEGLRFSWWLLPVALATASWGISFFFGCKNLLWAQTGLAANYNLLQLRKGVHPEQPQQPEGAQAAIAGVKTAMRSSGEKSRLYAVWQFRTLIAGAVLFIVWRVLEMYRLTYMV